MRWNKLGCLFSVEALHPKLWSHAANPLPVLIKDDLYRVFYSARDKQNRSSVGAIDFNIKTMQICEIYKEPFFTHGGAGSFFEHGVSIGNCYQANGLQYMLFMGWQTYPGQHWRGDIGRLRLTTEFSIELDLDQPLIGSDNTDPISLSYPWVMETASGGFDMWYGSTVAWDGGNGEMVHVIKHAFSRDGNIWHKDGEAIPWELGKAQAFSRPTVIREANGPLHMWFSYRSGTGASYRIGYATSPDARRWTLENENSGLSLSDNGWDSTMVEYPFVFAHGSETYMLYNGNGFGKSGFGLAVLETEL